MGCISESERRLIFSLGIISVLGMKQVSHLIADKDKIKAGVLAARDYALERSLSIAPQGNYFNEYEFIEYAKREKVLVFEDKNGQGDRYRINPNTCLDAGRNLRSILEDCPGVIEDDFVNMADEFLNAFGNVNYDRMAWPNGHLR